MFNKTKRKYNDTDDDYNYYNNDFKKNKYYNDDTPLFNLNSNKRKYSDDSTTNLIVKIQKVGLENVNRDNLIKLNDLIGARRDYLNSQINKFKDQIKQKESDASHTHYEIEDILSRLSDNPKKSKTYDIPENDYDESSQDTINPSSQDEFHYYQPDDNKMLNDADNIKQQLSYAIGNDITIIITEPINIQPADENVTKTYFIIQLFFYFMKILAIISKFTVNATVSTLIILNFIAIYLFVFIRQIFSVFINAPLHMKLLFIILIYGLYISNEYVAKIMDVILNSANFSLKIVGFPELFSINYWETKLELVTNEVAKKTNEAVNFMINTVTNTAQAQALGQGFNALMKNIMENTQATQSAAEVYKMAVESSQNMVNAQQNAAQVCQAASEVIKESIGTLSDGIYQNMDTASRLTNAISQNIDTTSQLTNAISQNIVASTELTHAIQQQPYNNIISNGVSGAAVAGLKVMGGIKDMLGIGGRVQATIGLGGNFKRRKNKTKKLKRRKTHKRKNHKQPKYKKTKGKKNKK